MCAIRKRRLVLLAAVACVAVGGCLIGGFALYRHLTSRLVLYPIDPAAEELRSTAFAIDVRQNGGEWQPLDVYNVKIDPDTKQNASDDDPVIDSPMVMFDFTGGVQVRIQRPGRAIRSAEVHPVSKGIQASVADGTVLLTLKQPEKLAVSLDGDHQDMVYLFTARPEEAPEDPGDGSLIRLGPGMHTFPESGAGVMKGGIADAAIYPRALDAAALAAYTAGELPAGPAAYWPFASDFHETVGGKDGRAVNTAAVSALDGRQALCFNGYDDALPTSYSLATGDAAYTLCVRAWLDPSREQVGNVLLSGLIGVRSDGRLYSYLGGWEYPFFSEDTVPMGEWVDIALVKDKMTLTFYINGKAAGSEQRTFTKTSSTVLFGAESVGNDLCLRDGQTLYLDGGAVVTGRILAYGVQDAAVRGRGILYRSPGQSLITQYAKHVEVTGITILDPRSMCTHLCESDGVLLRGVNMVSRLGATDGVHMKASRNVTVEDCFIRSNDDCIAVYASFIGYTGDAEHIAVRRCTLINDAAHAIFSGIHAAAGGNDRIQDLTFEDIDIVDSKCDAMDYQGVLALNAANDVTIDTVLFDDIRIEDVYLNQLFNLRVWMNAAYCRSSGRAIRNVTFRDITYNGENAVTSFIYGDGDERPIEHVSFENIVINGTRQESLDQFAVVGNFVRDITIQ